MIIDEELAAQDENVPHTGGKNRGNNHRWK